ncbi:MAG TPA: tRNA lysidine(34) synthetase TilS [Streptosporangiaceae bacterium]|nr:tRNA lysidine(34) synthetase TilS [Streptosporangiaceae bacterium]
MGPHPAVAEVRRGVRGGLAGLAPGGLVLAACSGGADSLALAAALAHEAPRQRLRAGGVTVDHGLQPGSAERAQAVAAILAGLGLDPVETAVVTVAAGGTGAGCGGPEAAARSARYQALDEAAARTGASAILLGHSEDDQAETVLLGLARGSGSRSLGGMPDRRGLYRRPLLGVRRATLRTACEQLGLQPWDDPHNTDPAFTRARVRHQALPALEVALGPGVTQALARTARQLRADADALDELAAGQEQWLRDGDGAWRADALAAAHPAVRSRVLRRAAIAAGAPPGALTAAHIDALDALLTRWHGQRWADLPGGVRAVRRYGKLIFTDQAEAVGGRE